MMGAGRVIVFCLFSAIPGVFLALLIWVMIGKPDTWETWMAIPCYGPIFGCMALGAWYGRKVNRDVEMEA
ncbi:MAG: hypothetical protein CMB52_04090 [Euryarchaeota archaeon]|nr:hypothetical protein [Euryarchaeota archaeon]|tara:strand:+ start:775 stop:984 length:210 start_codon:yes stop_codon:yes gene_type:complete